MTRASESWRTDGRRKSVIVVLVLPGLLLTGLAVLAVDYLYQHHILTDCCAPASAVGEQGSFEARR